ncbi:muconate cycloisomerase [Lampropedia aestuarii]|uniref:Muconate cycloisomerase n=1 Tax=Lampropedia aestuarii TaxID=2562762 RepID=A0A4S5BTS0_9BURK|nr:muconate/chloromuconate family cycloisomerase [Lampropedia aestuarii]MDH5855785.1 muconate/chloromuconate family cycloisomerase [Lampropedia aestuarii]THJ36070.1 muconate cycloisomerase [Lampropedia aestuarii]
MPHDHYSTTAPVLIEQVETFIVDLPTIRPHQLSMAIMQGQSLMLVRLRCSDGSVGIGEGTTIGGLAYGGESPEGMKLAIDTYFAPLLIGQNANAVPAVMARLHKAIRDNRFAKCAVETALFDALGHRLGLPISQLLGGSYRDSLPVAWTLASGDTGRDIEEAEQMLAQRRHQIFKLKIGRRSVAQDVAHVAAIKKALGERGQVRVDVNMAWSELQARHGLAALADAGCELAEQPVASAEALARLRGRYPIAIMADESLVGPGSAMDLARAQAADVFAIKIEQSGGLQAAQHVAAIGDAAGIELYGGTMLEGAIGTIASAHAFATFRQLQWGTELFGPLLLTEEILQQPLQYQDFQLRIPQGPGLGIALDEERIEHFRRDRSRSASVSMGATANAV